MSVSKLAITTLTLLAGISAQAATSDCTPEVITPGCGAVVQVDSAGKYSGCEIVIYTEGKKSFTSQYLPTQLSESSCKTACRTLVKSREVLRCSDGESERIWLQPESDEGREGAREQDRPVR